MKSDFAARNFGLQNFAFISDSVVSSNSSESSRNKDSEFVDGAKQRILELRDGLFKVLHIAPLSLGSMFQPQNALFPEDSKSQAKRFRWLPR